MPSAPVPTASLFKISSDTSNPLQLLQKIKNGENVLNANDYRKFLREVEAIKINSAESHQKWLQKTAEQLKQLQGVYYERHYLSTLYALVKDGGKLGEKIECSSEGKPIILMVNSAFRNESGFSADLKKGNFSLEIHGDKVHIEVEEKDVVVMEQVAVDSSYGIKLQAAFRRDDNNDLPPEYWTADQKLKDYVEKLVNDHKLPAILRYLVLHNTIEEKDYSIWVPKTQHSNEGQMLFFLPERIVGLGITRPMEDKELCCLFVSPHPRSWPYLLLAEGIEK